MASGRVCDAIEEYLGDWTLTPIRFENKDQDEDGDVLPPSPAVTFVDVQMAGTLYAMQSLGANPVDSNRWDEEGMLFLDVNVPRGQGASEGRTLAKQLADMFRGKTLLSDSLEFYDAGIGAGRPGRISGNWWVIPVWIRWRLTDEPIDGLE